MVFVKGFMDPDNIEQFMSEEKEILLRYCNHIAVFYFTDLRYERMLQSDSTTVYQCYLYEWGEDMLDPAKAKLGLKVTFDYERNSISVLPTFGKHTAEPNFSLGDGLAFIEESLVLDFFIDLDEDILDF